MTRKARERGEFFHIIVKGIGRQILFEDDEDRRKYLLLLQRNQADNNISLLVYYGYRSLSEKIMKPYGN